MHKQEIGKIVSVISRQIKRIMDMEVSDNKITGVQFDMIRYIYKASKKQDVFAKDIEKAFDIRRASMAGILQNMEKNGLIIRKDISSDGRLKKIILTKKAIEIREKYQKVIENLENEAVKGISKEEVINFLETAEKISKNLEKKERMEK